MDFKEAVGMLLDNPDMWMKPKSWGHARYGWCLVDGRLTLTPMVDSAYSNFPADLVFDEWVVLSKEQVLAGEV